MGKKRTTQNSLAAEEGMKKEAKKKQTKRILASAETEQEIKMRPIKKKKEETKTPLDPIEVPSGSIEPSHSIEEIQPDQSDLVNKMADLRKEKEKEMTDLRLEKEDELQKLRMEKDNEIADHRKEKEEEIDYLRKEKEEEM
ncbi:hypothetical protein PENTCL1PPCAC_27517, partial [Pristionchus entomophagus]